MQPRIFPVWLAATVIFAGQAFAPSSLSAAPPKVDYYFPAGGQRGTTVTVTASGTFERWPVQAYVVGNGVVVTPGKAKGALTVAIAADAEPGIYWIRLHDEQGASIARPFFVGTLPEVREKEPNDDPKKPHVLEQAGVTVNGQLDKAGAVDTFAVKLTKGQTLVASLEAHNTLRSPMDAVLQVLSPEGFVVDLNHDYHGFDPQIAYKAPKDGTYLVRLFAFPSVPDSGIRFSGKDTYVYRLTLTTGPYVEYAFPLAVPRSAPGSVELIGWNIPDKLRMLPVKPADGARDVKLYHPAIANAVSVRVEPGAALAETTATRQQPQAIVLPVTISGRLSAKGEVDVYQFEAKKGQKIPIRIEGRSLGFPIDPVLRVTDAEGKTLIQSQAKALGADPTLDFTATQDGKYRIEIRDLYSDGGMRHVYRFRAGAIEPDFELKVADDRFTVSAAKPLEIPVTITRLGGLKQEITLSVEGLPKNVTATATPKGISLRAAGDAAAFSGPIRIIGTAKDGTVRAARATIADLARPTENLWLTTIRK